MIGKVLINKDKTFYWEGGDFHTNIGIIKESDILKGKNKVRSSKGKEFLVFDANFFDQFKKLKRGPAVMISKDIGYILANTGISKDSNVLDAGSGCGFLASHLANFVKKVYSYERNEKFFNVAKNNFEYLDLHNVELKAKDVYEGISEKDLDLVVLDLPEPWNALSHVHGALKSGAFLVCYLPTIVQVKDLIDRADGFLHVKTVELLEREWHVDGNKVRPKSQMLGHTAFLVFLRRL